MRTLPLPPEPRFSKDLIELANTVYSTSMHFKNVNYLQYFAILLDKNILITMYYSKTAITLKIIL